MAKKNLFVIRNELDDFSQFVTELEKDTRFQVRTIDVSHVLSDAFPPEIEKIRLLDIAIALRDTVYDKERRHIQEQFRKTFRQGLFTFIILKTSPDMDDEDVLLGKTHCFYLPPSVDQTALAVNFILYAIKVFSEAVLSDRLQDYIINTVANIVDSEMLRKKKEEVERLNLELEKKNRIDALTSLFNRQAVFEALEREMKRVRRDVWRLRGSKQAGRPLPGDASETGTGYGNPAGDLMEHFGVFSVMMIDLDHFKNINDSYGHIVGDTVLKTVGDLLNNKSIFRETDIIGRFGGEEFIGIFPETNAKNVLIPVRRFVEELRKMKFTGPGGTEFSVTISAGISEFSLDDASTEAVVDRADKALYWAKEHGRDRITVYGDVFPGAAAKVKTGNGKHACGIRTSER